MCLLPFSAISQIRQAWAVHYNNGILNGTNEALKMALDSVGNLYVTGFSQNTNTNLGYVTIKYAPNGTQLWAARYDDTNYPTAGPSGIALDNSNNVVVTGNALTVKYDTNGHQLWTAPYNGSGIAVDTSGNAIVTGYASGFNTVKLSPNGSNLWSQSYVSTWGPAVSEAVVVDGGGNAYVAGSDTYICYQEGAFKDCYAGLLTVKYDPNGNQLWLNIPSEGTSQPQITGMGLDSRSNLDVVENFYQAPYFTFSYASDGSEIWFNHDPTDNAAGQATSLAIDKSNNVVVTGQSVPHSPNPQMGTSRIDTNGGYNLTNLYPTVPMGASAGTSVAIDQANSIYVTGYSPGSDGTNDIVTIKYDQNSNQIWLQRYASPGDGNAAGNAIAVDNSGNVYVTGYETTTAGGTEIVTIKYSPVTLQRRSDGTVILQAQGSPGEAFDIEASTDLLNWLDLGRVLADTNGLMQFDDTNAPAYPARFYYTTPQ